MPDRKTLQRARRDRREGKAASTQAGEFVREEIHHIREGKHGAASTKQAIAIGLSKARRAGVRLPPPPGASPEPSARAPQLENHGSARPTRASATRSRATTRALKRKGHSAASHAALARQAKSQARRRTAGERSRIARKASRTRARAQSSRRR